MGGAIYKEDGLVEIIEDYNARYGKDFTIPTHAKMKKDMAARLAHKKPYLGIERTPDQSIDVLIVVDQMLTGFDSKWINTLYLDKLLAYENVIQAFSRTNRLFGPEKPFGTIRYYRKPHTMKNNIDKAVKLYSGDRPLGLFVCKLGENLQEINHTFEQIEGIFGASGLGDFSRLPEGDSAKAKFAKTFKTLTQLIEAAKIQGFVWGQPVFDVPQEDGSVEIVEMAIDEQTYLTLALRYKELSTSGPGPDQDPDPEAPYDLDGYLTEIDTGRIDSDYMNDNFTKWLKALTQDDVSPETVEQLKNELHRSFASLTQDEQKYANIFLHDVESGNVTLEAGKTLRDYITLYQRTAKDDQLDSVARALGIDRGLLAELMSTAITDVNINEYGRFDRLCDSADRARAKAFFEAKDGAALPSFKVGMRIDQLLRGFILKGGFDLE